MGTEGEGKGEQCVLGWSAGWVWVVALGVGGGVGW